MPRVGTPLLIGFAAVVLCVAAHLHAQEPAPKFELISIRALPDNAPPVVREQSFTPYQPGGRYIDSATSLFVLITTAHGVRQPDRRLLGLPDWARRTRYAVSARASDDFPQLSPEADREQVRLMLREMLADRFRLSVRTEVRPETILKMTLERGGLQVKEVAPPVPPETEGPVNAALGDDGGRIIAKKSTMAGLARMVGLFLRQEVIDETGVQGYYDFDIRWSAPLPPGASRPTSGLGVNGIDLLMSTLKERIGVRFSGSPGNVEYWIVDRVEPPSLDN